MQMQEELVALIIETAKEIGEAEDWSVGEITAETILFGDGGVLDSMGLVSLVIAVEQAIEERFDRAVGLADEKAMSQKRSPYRSASRMAEYVALQLSGS